MKPEPLKNKEFLVLANRKCIKRIEGFEKEDIKSAVEWLKKEVCRCKTMVGEGKKCYACRNINKAFEDVIKEGK